MAQELCSTEKKCAGGENRLVRPEQVVTQQDA
jgi:hypothetical protein